MKLQSYPITDLHVGEILFLDDQIIEIDSIEHQITDQGLCIFIAGVDPRDESTQQATFQFRDPYQRGMTQLHEVGIPEGIARISAYDSEEGYWVSYYDEGHNRSQVRDGLDEGTPYNYHHGMDALNRAKVVWPEYNWEIHFRSILGQSCWINRNN